MIFWITTLLAMMMIGFAFMFASWADMNQGVISILFVVGAIYVAVAFFRIFAEVFSIGKLIGVIAMLIAIPMLAFGPAMNAAEHIENNEIITAVSHSDHMIYGFIAIGMGLTEPLFFTLKAVYLRIGATKLNFTAWDMAIDG